MIYRVTFFSLNPEFLWKAYRFLPECNKHIEQLEYEDEPCH
jgi:hypothetical protein